MHPGSQGSIWVVAQLKKKTLFLKADAHKTGTITIGGIDLTRAVRFKYFGSLLSVNSELRYEIPSRSRLEIESCEKNLLRSS